MTIETITFVYNESFLLPFYLKHYDYADRMNIFFDEDSSDNTLDLLKGNSKVNIIPFRFPDMMDEAIKVNYINELYRSLKCNRVLNVDCDEFIFSDRTEIESITEPITNCKFFSIYRHISEKDLDINLSIKEQRRHGYFDFHYLKPIIVNTGLNIKWDVGNHSINGGRMGKREILGAHWATADPCFCIKRRVSDRKERQSKINYKNSWTQHNHNITEQDILNECKLHENDGLVW